MDAPFVFGKIARQTEFTDRTAETHTLMTNFSSLINTIVISPRRWGKSSLVLKAANLASKQHPEIRVCFIDLFNVKTEQDFYQQLSQQILKATAAKWEDLWDLSKQFLGKFIPKISFSPDNQSEFTLGLDWEEVQKEPDVILNLSERIAESKGYKIIVCIDEFQNIAEFDEPLKFQKKLRSHWQKHSKTAYCLYGSRRHMMMDVFTSSSMPFYKFGHLMFLQKIALSDWEPFIVQRFRDTNKDISSQNASLIATLTECHSYYTQQLAQQCWLRSTHTCDTSVVYEAHESLTLQLSLLFQTITDGLTAPQVNFLHAILNKEEKLGSMETLKKYKLGTSSHIPRIKQALLNKDIIDVQGKQIDIMDPYYSYWLKVYYFKSQ